MLDQSDNLNYYFLVVLLFQIYNCCCVGCGVWFQSWFGSGCACRAGLASVFPIIFVLYLDDLLSEASLSTSPISSL